MLHARKCCSPRGIILVEGEAEKFLLPVFAETMKHPLDHFGITVCSVAGTNFRPYTKFLTALGIPFSIVTDWDPRNVKRPLGFNRALRLIELIQSARTGRVPSALIKELDAMTAYNEFSTRCEAFGIFTNSDTLEVDLFKDNDFTKHIIATLREQNFSTERKTWIDQWEAQPKRLDVENYLTLIDAVGKGRFAQRLASRIAGILPPNYIKDAIKFVVSRV